MGVREAWAVCRETGGLLPRGLFYGCSTNPQRAGPRLRAQRPSSSQNEESLKKCVEDYIERVEKEAQKYQALKAQAEEKLQQCVGRRCSVGSGWGRGARGRGRAGA